MHYYTSEQKKTHTHQQYDNFTAIQHNTSECELVC